MLRYQNEELNLQFEVYEDPLWAWEVDSSSKYKKLIINSPKKHYPFAQFEITPLSNIKVTEKDIHDVALSSIKQAQKTFGLAAFVGKDNFQPKMWGFFSGYQTTFNARVDGHEISILYFVGRNIADNRLITMAATTQYGKLEHIKEHIRRCFTWVSYVS